MATDPTVINDGVGNKSYNLVSLTETEAIFRDAATSLQEPNTLRISHQNATKATGTDRHLVQLGFTKEDTDDLETPYTGLIHVVIAAPRKAVAEADMLLEWVKLHTYITANFAALYAGFMP